MTHEQQSDMSIEDAQRELQVSTGLMNALLVSGLLGYWENGRYPHRCRALQAIWDAVAQRTWGAKTATL